MEWWGWLILIVLNVPVFIAIGWVLFSTWDEFFACVKFWLMPDIVSLFRGEWVEDWWAEFKLFVWAVFCAGCVWAEWWALTKYILP